MKRKPVKCFFSPISGKVAADLPDLASQDAVFGLDAANSVLPSGWVSLDARLRLRTWDSKVALCWKTPNGSNKVYYPSMTLSGKVRELIYLEPGSRDVFCIVPADSEPQSIVLTKVGTLSRLRRLLYRTTRVFFFTSRRKRLRAGITAWRLLTDLGSAYYDASKLRTRSPALPYAQWIERFDTLSERDRRRIRKRCRQLRSTPTISLAITAGSVNAENIAATLASLRQQLYPHWQLLIAVSSDCAAELKQTLQALAAEDQRVELIWELEKNRSDSLLKAANNGYIGRIDAGDLLAEHALYCIAAELETHPDAILVYTDEDQIDATAQRHTPNFKPDWNRQLLLSHNYLGNLCVYRANTLIDANITYGGFNNAATYGLNLRITSSANVDRIRHIALPLYHRRESGYDVTVEQDAGKQVLMAHLAAQNISAEVSAGDVPGSYHIRYALPPLPPLVSIIIPSRDEAAMLQCCIDSIRKLSSYTNYEIVVVDNQSSEPDAIDYLQRLKHTPGIIVLRYDQPFNYAAINNYAVEYCRGEVLCLLNNDTEVLTPGWLEEMLGLLYQPEVAVVGAKLYYADDTIQHAGDLVGMGGIAHHAHAFLPRDNPGYQGRAQLAQDMSAVTGACMMIRRSVYEALGGLNAADLPVAFNDVDFCLRVREAGWRVVWTPWAELYHYESKSRGADDTEEKIARMQLENNYMQRRWSHWLEHDPAYNPNLSQERPDFSLSHAPLSPRPW